MDAIDNFHENIQKIDRKYPAPPTPLDQDTFAVKSITEEERKKRRRGNSNAGKSYRIKYRDTQPH